LITVAQRLAGCITEPSPCPQALKLVVVFIVGGTTFQEARLVADLNAAGEQQRCYTD